MTFLESIRHEWSMAAASVAADGSDLASEMGFDFAGHENEAAEKARAQSDIMAARKAGKPQRGMVSSFVHGWYSARNSCTAQGGHGGHGHNLGPNFGNFENTGASGPEMSL